MILKQKEKDGISLRRVHFWLIVGAVIISGLMFYSTYHLSTSFRSLTETSEQQIELRKAARELMDASDYLTESVQRFTVLGDKKYLDEYFTEAFGTKRREEAISRMSAANGNDAALAELQEAMASSLELMNREYYAMRLVIEAKRYTDYPDELKEIELSKEDQALSPEEKMQRASVMVHDEEYYVQKNLIREDMSSRLGIHPVLNAVDQIKADSPIPEVGAEEFRYLARAYNKMYEIYKNSLERLNFKASHDELTGAYNRSGYDLLLSSVDLENVYMLLFDIDNFKEINDTYGHEVGDKVLIKLVSVLKRYFRSDDYVCRIGGDEFVVFMVHAAKPQQQQIEEKITGINRELANTEDGLPSASVSVGIVHGSESSDAEDLFRKIDDAMYQAKQRGKNTYSFYKK